MSRGVNAEIETRFEFGEEAAHGAFGEVLRGRDRSTGTPVAIKRLRKSTPDAIARFQIETQLLAQIEHPHVVRYIAHGPDARGDPCLVLEWLDGEDLGRRIRRGRVPAREAVRIAQEIASALHALHAHAIVHRDVKPSNVFLCANADGSHSAKLLDLGVARQSFEPTVTVEGLRIGTPAYMSPEQARGDVGVTGRSDLFSLGSVLYEMLAGGRPFRAADPYALLAKIVLEEPPALEMVAPHVPPMLAAIVRRAMAKIPAERFGTGSDMSIALAQLDPATLDVASEVESGTTTVATGSSLALATGEQRIVTALFARFDQADDARAHAFAERVVANGGAWHSILGGRAVGVFGLARSRGDEALRAARVALAVIREGGSSGARVAISTCMVTTDVSGVSGDAIERAADQLDRAPEGVVLDTATARLVATHFVIETRGDKEVLVGERTAPDDAGPRLFGLRTPTVGRDRELAMLEGIFDEVLAESVARVALVTAGAGVGKSRLRYEFLRRVRERSDQVETWMARGDAVGAGSPFAMLAQAIRRAAGIVDTAALEQRQEALRNRVARSVPAGQVERITEFLAEIVGAPFPDDHSVRLRSARRDPQLMGDQMRAAWEEFVLAESAAHPVLVVLEDLHWGDLPSVRFLDAALRSASDRPLMVLALARPEVHSALPSLWSERGVHEIRLAELPRRAAERLVRDVLGEATAPATVQKLVECAAGNAFFLEELMRAERENRGDALPDTVLALLQARLDALEHAPRVVLRAASAFGRTFWASGAEALVADTLSHADVEQALARLVEREVVTRRAEGRFAGEPEYVFRHALVRDAAYALLGDADRAKIHRIAGQWLEHAGERDAVALAEHFDRGRDSARAQANYARAAEQALEANEYALAVSHAEKAIQCGAAGEMLGRLRRLQAEALQWQGDNVDARRCATEALDVLRPGSASWYLALCEAGIASLRFADERELLALADRLRSTVQEPEAIEAFRQATIRFARWLRNVGQAVPAEALLAKIGTLDDETAERDPALMAQFHQMVAEHAHRQGDPGAFLEHASIAAEWNLKAGDFRRACMQQGNTGYAYYLMGSYDRAEPPLRAALAIAERMRLGFVRNAVLHNLGIVLGRRGRFDEAFAMEREALEAFQADGDKRMESGARAYLAILYGMRGDWERAAEETRQALTLTVSAHPLRLLSLAVHAAAQNALGHRERALELYTEAEPLLASPLGNEEGDALIRLVRAEALAARGELDAARETIRVGKARLLERAAALRDPAMRTTFLQNVPENAQTFALAEAWSV